MTTNILTNQTKSKELIQGGALANINGNGFEAIFEKAFRNSGVSVVTYATYKKHPEKYEGKRILVKNVPFESIYGSKRSKTEFLLKDPILGDFRIECKYQASAGSVDEKFPYVYLNALLAYPEENVIIAVDGGGYKAGALSWLKETIENGLVFKNHFKNPLVEYHMKEAAKLAAEEKNIQLMNGEQLLTWIYNLPKNKMH